MFIVTDAHRHECHVYEEVAFGFKLKGCLVVLPPPVPCKIVGFPFIMLRFSALGVYIVNDIVQPVAKKVEVTCKIKKHHYKKLLFYLKKALVVARSLRVQIRPMAMVMLF